MLSQQYALERLTAPSVYPITLDEAREQMRIDDYDSDALILRLISAATSFVDAQGVLGKAIITQTWAQWVGQSPGTVTLMLGPVQSVDAVKYYDTDGVLQTDMLSNYEVFGTANRKTIAPKSGFNWPTTQNRDDAIKIEYTVGYGNAPSSVPEAVRQAMLMLVAHWYETRENEIMGTISKNTPYGFSELLDIERNTWYG